jgi:cytochrome c1
MHKANSDRQGRGHNEQKAIRTLSPAAAQLDKSHRHQRITYDADGKASKSPNLIGQYALLSHSGERGCKSKKAFTDCQKIEAWLPGAPPNVKKADRADYERALVKKKNCSKIHRQTEKQPRLPMPIISENYF